MKKTNSYWVSSWHNTASREEWRSLEIGEVMQSRKSFCSCIICILSFPRIQEKSQGKEKKSYCFIDVIEGKKKWWRKGQSICKQQQATHIHQERIFHISHGMHIIILSDRSHWSIWRKGCCNIRHTWCVSAHWDRWRSHHGNWRSFGRADVSGRPIFIQEVNYHKLKV